MKWVWRALAGILLILTAGLALGYFWLRAGLPDYEGERTLAGLGAPATVVRDAAAIPHIRAESAADAYFALGYVHASDRLWQMDLQRRIGAGRLSELAFIGESGLRLDRLMRTLGLYRDAAASFERLPAEVRAALEAYSAGVNAWLQSRSGPLPPEFVALRYEPEPWTPADSLVWGRLIALQLSGNFRTELLRAALAEILDPALMEDLFPPGIGYPPATLAAGEARALRAALPPPLGPDTASNEWVLSGEHTGTGLPILANDPHLALDAPILWYLASIRTPELTVTGATVPGVPFTLLGHNGTVAWGFTTTGSDVQDVFIERIDPADPGRYLTPEGSEPFLVREEIIGVHGREEPVRLTVRATRHGPVLSDIDPEAADRAGEDHVLALAWTALTDEDLNVEAVYRLNRARDWEDFRAAMRLWRAPQQNVVYADTAGNIGFFTPGDVPIRLDGDGRSPIPGWTGAFDWKGLIPFEELPQAYNPPAGWFVNANNAVVGPDYPYLLAWEFEEPYRARRIEAMLEEISPLTVAGSQEMQLDTVSLAAAELLPLMLTIRAPDAHAAEALAALRRWDHRMNRELAAPLIFQAWLLELGRSLYADELGDGFDDYGGLEPVVLRRMLTERRIWCDDVETQSVEECGDALTTSLLAALDRLEAKYGSDPSEWRWGEAHRAPLDHPIFSRIPIIDRLFDLGIQTDGGEFTVNRGGMDVGDAATPFAHVHGAGFRAVYDLADLTESQFMIATGQSGHPLSDFYGNLTVRWRDGDYLTIGETPRDPIGTLTLLPADQE
ncbi:penicillin acylase family protein [Inquilinus sp. CAU 1745]|uniref:penicillin acylase family protein n=1 Tax=Inquilinus sp. CAU 1745 TaxID=3140369 RepID=UPI00325BBFC1